MRNHGWPLIFLKSWFDMCFKSLNL
jgi:hypothetical protein